MNEKEQRIKIAEACGLTDLHWISGQLHYGSKLAPDYLNDLNAMHEAEKSLPNDDDIRCEFVDHLTSTVNGMWADAKRRFECATATAAQRAEAFLKTLKLWEHTK